MRSKNLLHRFLFCLPFIAIVLYIRSYHGELINNTQVTWQYVQDTNRKIYLALDVYSPSGLKIESICSSFQDITNSWRLVNYPDWYKGRDKFPGLNAFQDVLHPYLPYNKDYNVLYTTEWYTFLYEWNSADSLSLPPEKTLTITYVNIGTQNRYKAEYRTGITIIPTRSSIVNGRPVFVMQILYPVSPTYRVTPRGVLDNVKVLSPSEFALEDLHRNDYGIYVQDEEGKIIDSVRGFVRWDDTIAFQVYWKPVQDNQRIREGWLDFHIIFRHIAAVVFIGYFVLICRIVGCLFITRFNIVLNSTEASFIISIFIGTILLTYLFFLVGLLKLLYFPVVSFILFLLLFFGHDDTAKIVQFKSFFFTKKWKVIQQPYKIVCVIILCCVLLYNLSYCFIPATYVDGSGDIVNSYLPIINDYILSHSFQVQIYSSTYSISPQTFDILRTVVAMIAGEPGVYLLSFIYLLLIIGAIFLIGKEIFYIRFIIIYLVVLGVLSGNLFTEALHLGKLYTATLAYLLISLYSICFFDCKKRYYLPAIFLGFLVSSSNFFLMYAASYYLFVFVYSFLKYKTIQYSVFRLHLKSLLLFSFLSSIFILNLLLEVGVPFPPGMVNTRVSNFFLTLNQDNELYKYIDNNYIRHFYRYHPLAFSDMQPSVKDIAQQVFSAFDNLQGTFLFFFSPFLLFFKRKNRYCGLYLFMVLCLLLSITAMFSSPPHPYNHRVKVYYYYPLVILQGAIIGGFVQIATYIGSKVSYLTPNFSQKKTLLQNMLIIFILFVAMFEIPFASIDIRTFKFVDVTWNKIDYQNNQRYLKNRFFRDIVPVVLGSRSKYDYLRMNGDHQNFDHAMLIRQYTKATDVILIIPVRFHSHVMRHITAQHALGSVIYQKDIASIMADLKKFNIRYLSYIPIHPGESKGGRYDDYNPFYTPILEDGIFSKYFKLLFSEHERKFYEIIYDGTNAEYSPSPYNVKGLPFIPMLK